MLLALLLPFTTLGPQGGAPAVAPGALRDLGEWLHAARHSPRQVLRDVRRVPAQRTRTCGAAGFALGMCVVPRTRGPDYSGFRTAEGWRQRLLSIKTIPVHQRMLMSLPIALAFAFLADAPGNAACVRSSVSAHFSRATRRRENRPRLDFIQLPPRPSFVAPLLGRVAPAVLGV
ncbi:hypothetical protein T492DRAFT_869848 [Pavlovales sp. CCMP2436]|nr:hypothetical protein T492DRAFT_869848 [Pavlovales sp. CCMP2436]